MSADKITLTIRDGNCTKVHRASKPQQGNFEYTEVKSDDRVQATLARHFEFNVMVPQLRLLVARPCC